MESANFLRADLENFYQGYLNFFAQKYPEISALESCMHKSHAEIAHLLHQQSLHICSLYAMIHAALYLDPRYVHYRTLKLWVKAFKGLNQPQWMEWIREVAQPVQYGYFRQGAVELFLVVQKGGINAEDPALIRLVLALHKGASDAEKASYLRAGEIFRYLPEARFIELS